MKKKGFTLVELLAVIVILAIIALIATPMILGVIEDARKGSAKSSALGYVEAVEKSSLIYTVNNGNSFADGTYTVEGKNLLQNNTVVYTVDYKGDTATGTIIISNGEVTEAELIFGSIIDKKIIITDNNVTIGDEAVKEPEDEPTDDTNKEPEVVYGATKELPTNNETYKAIVYLDPTDLTRVCNAENVVSTTGTKTGCMKFYAFAETDTTYDLILDHNTTPLVAWNLTGSNTEMKEVKNELDKLVSESEWTITPRLITADEVAILTGANNSLKWTSDKIYANTPVIGTSISWFYLDGVEGTDVKWHKQIAKTQGASKYSWIFDNTYDCTSYGCNISDNNEYEYGTDGSINNVHGYWTSNHTVGLSNYVWYLNRYGCLSSNGAGYDYYGGVRPVITISKLLFLNEKNK